VIPQTPAKRGRGEALREGREGREEEGTKGWEGREGRGNCAVVNFP